MLSDAQLARLDEDLGFLGDRLESNRPIGPLTTYRVGGAAARFVEVDSAEELAAIATALARRVRPVGSDVAVVGKGSNLLVADAGVASLVLQLGDGFGDIEVLDGDVPTVRAGGAVSLPVLARRTVAMGLRGLEWTVGVPGSVGGAVRMNAGGHGAEVADRLVGVRLIDLRNGEDVHVDAAALDLAYRSSSVRSSQVVASAEFRVERTDGADGADEIAEIVRWRREHQPGGQNAGSVFANPEGDSAGRLIDEAGCKGRRVGSAEVSRKHANFIQADPDGSADDVRALMLAVRDAVEAHSGVRLHPETVMLGFDDEDDPWA